MADYIEENAEIVSEAQRNEEQLQMMNASSELIIENAGIGTFQTGLARAVNETYSYANNSMFFALVPSYLRDYMWRYVRVACQWLDGYVPSLHQEGVSGILSTHIGGKLITGLTKQVVGEKLIFKPNDKNDDKSIEALKVITKWANESNIIKAVYSAIGFALAIGTSLLKINKTIDGKLWWEGCRFDNCFYLGSFQNQVQEATFKIRNYVDTREGKSNQQFYLIEHRYYKVYDKPDIVKKLDGTYETIHRKGEKVPMVEYKVCQVRGTMMSNVLPSDLATSSIPWKQLPQEIRNNLKRDYGVLRVDEPQELGLSDLGVYPLLNAEIDLSIPTGTNFGESMLVGIQDDLIHYEVANAYELRDMYLGKGTVYVPKSLNISDSLYGGSVLQGVGNEKIEQIKGVNPEQQQILVQQFNIRVDEWQKSKENALKCIAVKWGMSPKILASFLAGGPAQQTATQVDSEDDLSIAFIYHTRSYFKDALNKALETTLNYMGYKTNIEIDFASPSLLNKDRLLDRVKNQLEIGVIDIEEAIRILNPDLDEVAIQSKVEKAQQLQQQQMMAQLTELGQQGQPTDLEYEQDILNGNGPIE